MDAASLLRLYLNFDLLDAAAELVLEYVDALLGKGHQYFGIEVRRSDESVSLEVFHLKQLSENMSDRLTQAELTLDLLV